jgi:hypothetical protein
MGDQNYQSKLDCFADLLHRTSLFGGEAGANLNELYGVTSTRNEYYTGKVLEADFALVSESLWFNEQVKSFTVNPDTSTDHALLTLEVDV